MKHVFFWLVTLAALGTEAAIPWSSLLGNWADDLNTGNDYFEFTDSTAKFWINDDAIPFPVRTVVSGKITQSGDNYAIIRLETYRDSSFITFNRLATMPDSAFMKLTWNDFVSDSMTWRYHLAQPSTLAALAADSVTEFANLLKDMRAFPENILPCDDGASMPVAIVPIGMQKTWTDTSDTDYNRFTFTDSTYEVYSITGTDTVESFSRVVYISGDTLIFQRTSHLVNGVEQLGTLLMFSMDFGIFTNTNVTDTTLALYSYNSACNLFTLKNQSPIGSISALIWDGSAPTSSSSNQSSSSSIQSSSSEILSSSSPSSSSSENTVFISQQKENTTLLSVYTSNEWIDISIGPKTDIFLQVFDILGNRLQEHRSLAQGFNRVILLPGNFPRYLVIRNTNSGEVLYRAKIKMR